MQTLFERQEVIRSYDRSIKVMKNGHVELKLYDSNITYADSGFVKFNQKEFLELLDCKRPRINPNKQKTDFKINRNVSNSCELKEIRADSLTRSRQLLIDYASENVDKFHSFITLTFGEDITDVEIANKCFANWRKQISRYCKAHDKEFYYLGVPEFQKSGRVHYHVLTSFEHDVDIIKKEPIKTYNKNKHKYYTIEYYDILYWNYGYSSSFDLDKSTDYNFNLALYIIKYLYKDLDERLFGRKKVLKSNNLEKPNVYKLSSNDVTWQTAYAYILDNIYNKKIDVQNTYRVEASNDKPYIKTQTILHLDLRDNNNILQDILQARLEF